MKTLVIALTLTALLSSTGPEVIDIEPVDRTIIHTVDECKPQERVTEHDLDEQTVETLCEFLWKSPLHDPEVKKKLLWVVFNRADDTSGLFADDIASVCTNKREFPFMTAHRYAISDENREIVEQELNRWLSKKDGNFVGETWSNALYCDFTGEKHRDITLYDKDWREVE